MRLAFSLAALLAGCGPFAPVEGTWTTDNGPFTDDSCDLFDDDDTGEPAVVTQEIAVVDDTTFTSTNDLGDTWTCTLDDRDFTCPAVLTDEEPVEAMDATLPLEVAVSGSFADERTLSGTLSFDMNCSGTDCAAVEAYLGATFPCTAQRTLSATAND